MQHKKVWGIEDKRAAAGGEKSKAGFAALAVAALAATAAVAAAASAGRTLHTPAGPQR